MSTDPSTIDAEKWLTTLTNLDFFDTDLVLPEGVICLDLKTMTSRSDFLFQLGHELFGFEGQNGHASWTVPHVDGGLYYLFSYMTTAEERPLRWTVKDSMTTNMNMTGNLTKDEVSSSCSYTMGQNSITGSWDVNGLQWFVYGPFHICGDTFQFVTNGYWPHVQRFVLVPAKLNPSRSTSSTLQHNQPAVLVEKIASIPERKRRYREQKASSTESNFVAILRRPIRMSENVTVDSSMIIVNGTHGYYEFEFINECWAESVYFDVTYSTGDFRPIRIVVSGSDNNAAQEDCICLAESGGYGAEDFIHQRYGPYFVSYEVNTVQVTTDGNYFPHIGEIRVVDVRDTDTLDNNAVTKPQPSLGNWIVPPSQTMRPELVNTLKDFCFLETTQEPNPNFEPDPTFYNGINCDGLWVLASKEVDYRVLQNAADLLRRYIPLELRRLCLQWRAPMGMPRGPFRVIILDHVTNQQAGDCPEFPDDLPGRNGTWNPGVFTSADDFPLCPTSDSSCGDLTVHEVTHGLDMVLRQQVDPYFFQELDDCYQSAVQEGIYRKSYAAADRHEYLAEICTLFVGTHPHNFQRGCCQCEESKTGYCDWEPHRNFPPGPCGVSFRHKSDLIRSDLRGYEFLKTFLIELNDPDDDTYWWQL